MYTILIYPVSFFPDVMTTGPPLAADLAFRISEHSFQAPLATYVGSRKVMPHFELALNIALEQGWREEDSQHKLKACYNLRRHLGLRWDPSRHGATSSWRPPWTRRLACLCRNRRGCFALPCQGVSQKGFSAGEGYRPEQVVFVAAPNAFQ